MYFWVCYENSIQKISGDNNEEEIPVPMPNTEVKLLSAEDTWELPFWENRKSPVFYFYKKAKISNVKHIINFCFLNLSDN